MIGLATPLTGDYAEIGRDSRRGAEMALDEVNKGGGFAGHKGKLVVQDTVGQPAAAVNAVAKLTQDSGAQFLLGPDLSTETLAAMDTSKRAKIPQLTSSISPEVTDKGSEWLFRARASDAANAEIMVRYGVQKLKLKHIAVLYSLDAYGQGGLPAIQSSSAKYDAHVVLTRGVTPGTKDVTSQITAAKNADADGILWWGLVPETAVVEKAVKQLGFTGPLFGANALVNISTVKLVGNDADGVIAATTFVASDPDPKAQDFVKKYTAKYHDVPNDHAPLYYDMVMATARAVAQAGSTDPAKVRDAMRTVSYEGITGSMKWDAKGDYASRSAVIVEVKNGEPTVTDRSD